MSAEALQSGVLALQLSSFEAWLSSPLNLDREGVGAQAGRSVSNIRGHVARFLGFAASQVDPEQVGQLGLLTLLDGELLMEFVAYLLRERAVQLSSCVQAAHALVKARAAQPCRSAARASAEQLPSTASQQTRAGPLGRALGTAPGPSECKAASLSPRRRLCTELSSTGMARS